MKASKVVGKVLRITNDSGNITNHLMTNNAREQLKNRECNNCGDECEEMRPRLAQITRRRLDVDCFLCPACFDEENGG